MFVGKFCFTAGLPAVAVGVAADAGHVVGRPQVGLQQARLIGKAQEGRDDG